MYTKPNRNVHLRGFNYPKKRAKKVLFKRCFKVKFKHFLNTS